MTYQLLPPLSQDEYEGLKASIARNGVLQAVEVDIAGNVVDGHHRIKACQELGINGWPTIVKEFSGEAEKRAYVYMVNLARRQLSHDQLREIREQQKSLAYELRQQGRTEQEIAGLLGISRQTISYWLCQEYTSIASTGNASIDIRLSIPREAKGAIFERVAKDGETQARVAADFGISQQRVGQIVNEEKKKQKKQAKEKAKAAQPKPSVVVPNIVVGNAAHLDLEDESIDVIITSPPYNLGAERWPMGGQGRQPRENGIGYKDSKPEDEYQREQIEWLIEWYRVAKPGASLFYNHKIRQRDGEIIHPLDWLRSSNNPWIIRQEIIWDRESTHNHCPSLFWPQDERIYWMTKGKPAIPDDGIGLPSIWRFHGPEPNTWHPAPFPEELPRRCLKAIGRPGIIVLDPCGGRMTTCKVASEMGYQSIGIDINPAYIERAKKEDGWMTESGS